MASETMPQSRRLLTEYSLVKVRVRAAVAAGQEGLERGVSHAFEKSLYILKRWERRFAHFFLCFFRQNEKFSVFHNSAYFFHTFVMRNPVTLRVARFTLKNPSIYLSNGKAVLAYVFGQILKILCFA